jgi:hypothetical protein
MGNVVKNIITCLNVQLGSKMLSDIRQLAEECGKREKLSSQRNEDRREVGPSCNLPTMSRLILVFAVNPSLCILTCNRCNIEFQLI